LHAGLAFSQQETIPARSGELGSSCPCPWPSTCRTAVFMPQPISPAPRHSQCSCIYHPDKLEGIDQGPGELIV